MPFVAAMTKRQRHLGLFEAMTQRLGLRKALASRAGNGAAERRALDRCMDCSAVSACETWLGETGAAATSPDFCRNHDMFERLKHDIEAERRYER